METEILRRRVWDEMIFAGMRAQYFAELVRKYQELEKGLRVAVLVSSSGAAATVMSAVPGWLKLGFPIAAASGSLWLLFSQYGMMARDAADLHAGWSAIEARYERVWNQLESDSAESDFNRIYEDANTLSKAGTKFPNRPKRLAHLMDQTAAILTARYA